MSLTEAVNLPRHGRSRGTLLRRSSFHTHTGTWRICTACPSTPDETKGEMKSELMSDLVKLWYISKSNIVHALQFFIVVVSGKIMFLRIKVTIPPVIVIIWHIKV